MNKGLYRNNKVDVKGGFFRRGKIEVAIAYGGKQHYVGRFSTREDADTAARAFRDRVHGEFARHA